MADDTCPVIHQWCFPRRRCRCQADHCELSTGPDADESRVTTDPSSSTTIHISSTANPSVDKHTLLCQFCQLENIERPRTREEGNATSRDGHVLFAFLFLLSPLRSDSWLINGYVVLRKLRIRYAKIKGLCGAKMCATWPGGVYKRNEVSTRCGPGARVRWLSVCERALWSQEVSQLAAQPSAVVPSPARSPAHVSPPTPSFYTVHSNIATRQQ